MFRLVIAIVCFSLVSGIAISIPVFAKEKYVVEVYQPDKVYP